MKNCTCTTLRLDEEFADWEDFRKFEKLLSESDLVQVPVTIKDSPVNYHEKWYRCPKCSRTWELTPPDFPYPGEWSELHFKKA